MRRLSVLLFGLMLAAPAAAYAGGPLQLNTVKLPNANDGTEPRITVGPDDLRWAVTNDPTGAVVFNSKDGGLTWQKTKADPVQRSATIDTDIVAMHTGRILASELDDAGLNFPSSVTDDGGATWTEAKGSTELADQDRQWFAVGPDDPTTHQPTVYLLYHNLSSGEANHNMYVSKSTDGGLTFGPPIPTTLPGDAANADLQCADSGGPSSITVNNNRGDPNYGRIYVVFTTRASSLGGQDFGGCAATPLEFNIVNATRVWVATSADDSVGSWKQSLAVDKSATGNVVSMQLAYGALDNQGGFYIAYPESPKPYPDLGGAALRVTYQHPAAGGVLSDSKWSKPVTLVPPDPSGDNGVTLVHIVAGDPGKVAIADYQAKHIPQAGNTPVWYPHLLQSLDLLSGSPHVTDQQISQIPAYKWTASEMMGICGAPTPVQGVQNGTSCPRSTDVWGVALDSQCRVSVAWPTYAPPPSSGGIVTGKLPGATNAPPAGSSYGLPNATPGTFVTTQTGGPDLCGGSSRLPGGSAAAPFVAPASAVQGASRSGLGCVDRRAPRSRVTGRIRASRKRLSLHGVSSDRGCRNGRAGSRSSDTSAWSASRSGAWGRAGNAATCAAMGAWGRR
jgi:BNR repeat-like domain